MMIATPTAAAWAAGVQQLALTDARALELAAELRRLDAAVSQAAAILDFDSAPADFQRVLEGATPIPR